MDDLVVDEGQAETISVGAKGDSREGQGEAGGGPMRQISLSVCSSVGVRGSRGCGVSAGGDPLMQR